MHSFLEEIFTKVNYFFNIFIANKIFKIIFTKKNHTRYYYIINIFIAYSKRALMLVKIVFFNFSIINIYNFSYLFL